MVRTRWSGMDQLPCLRKMGMIMTRWSGMEQLPCLRKMGSQMSEAKIDNKVLRKIPNKIQCKEYPS